MTPEAVGAVKLAAANAASAGLFATSSLVAQALCWLFWLQHAATHANALPLKLVKVTTPNPAHRGMWLSRGLWDLAMLRPRWVQDSLSG